MKRLLYPLGLLVFMALAVVSCQKEELSATAALEEPSLKASERGIPQVDLEIVALGTSLPDVTTSCGPALPDATCSNSTPGNGVPLIAAVINNGPDDLPPGSFQVSFVDLNTFPGPQSTQTRSYAHPGIPAGTSIRVNAGFFLGPCDLQCTPPVNFIRSYIAGVDPNNVIPETVEGNNRSNVLQVCTGC